MNPTSKTVKHFNAEQYVVRGQYWLATIFLDNDSGQISVMSSWNHNYSHCWSTPGRGKESLKEFLITAGPDYIMNKFSYGSERWFDHKQSLQQLKREVLAWRRNKTLDKNTARRIWDEIKDILEEDGMNSTAWYYQVNKCDELMNGYSGDFSSIPCITDYHPHLRAFMQEVWPVFIEQLKQELTIKKLPDINEQKPLEDMSIWAYPSCACCGQPKCSCG